MIRYKAKWKQLNTAEDESRVSPPLYTPLWLRCADGSVLKGQRIGDTYHGSDRIKWDCAGYSGFQDLAIYHGHPDSIVTHWALYIEPDKPLGPGLK